MATSWGCDHELGGVAMSWGCGHELGDVPPRSQPAMGSEKGEEHSRAGSCLARADRPDPLAGVAQGQP